MVMAAHSNWELDSLAPTAWALKYASLPEK